MISLTWVDCDAAAPSSVWLVSALLYCAGSDQTGTGLSRHNSMFYDPTERSLIQDALFKKCHQYLDACKKTWKTDHSDQTAINSTFDTIVQIMDGLKFERSSERSPTATPIHPS